MKSIFIYSHFFVFLFKVYNSLGQFVLYFTLLNPYIFLQLLHFIPIKSKPIILCPSPFNTMISLLSQTGQVIFF